jgi:hypothetical protein
LLTSTVNTCEHKALTFALVHQRICIERPVSKCDWLIALLIFLPSRRGWYVPLKRQSTYIPEDGNIHIVFLIWKEAKVWPKR